QLGFYDLLGVVPSAARVGHKDGLVQAEQGNGNQITNKEIRFGERKRERREKHYQKDIEHAFLRVLRTNLDHFLAVGYGSLCYAFQPNIGFDEFHRAIGAGGDRLHGSSGKPIDDGAARDQAEQEGGVENGEVRQQLRLQLVGQRHDDGENHGRCAHYGSPDQHGLGCRLERVTSTVVLFHIVFALFEVRLESEILLDFAVDVGDAFDGRKLEHRLSIIGDGAVGV